MDQEKIGKFILKLRKEKEMTQQELADKLNVTDRAVSHWENGRTIPDIALLKPICEIFNVTINELISGERLTNEILIKKSDENIINTLNYNKKSIQKTIIKNIIIIVVLILLLIITVLFLIFNKRKMKDSEIKMDIYNFTIQPSDPEKPYFLSKMYNIDKQNIYYYGIDFAHVCNMDDQCFSIVDVLKNNQITIDEFENYLNNQAQYENFKIMQFNDGGTKVYLKGGMQIILCNTIDGNKDIYIGNEHMLDNLHGEYCGHNKNIDESYIRTYKVLSITIKDDNYNEVILEDIDGNHGTVLISNSYLIVPGYAYYFTFLTFDKFDVTIENIFANSTLLNIKKVDGDKRNWINEDIIVNEDLDNESELNELEHVRMDIVDGTLTKNGAKIKITDFSGNKYTYGDSYRIDVYRNGKWEELEKYCPTNNCAWNLIAYGPDLNGHLLFNLDWSYLYGELPSGRYRIVKDVLRNDEKCSETQCNVYYFSVNFDID